MKLNSQYVSIAEQYVSIAQIISTLIGAISVFIAAIGLFRTAKANKRQTNAQILLDCAKRYEKIIESCPVGVWLRRFDKEYLPPDDPLITQAFLRYLNLFCEEKYLKKQEYFSEDIWYVWEELFKRTLQGALFKREWEKIKDEYKKDPEFSKYIEEVQKLQD